MEENMATQLIEALVGIEFDRRYYAYYDANCDRMRRTWAGVRRQDFEAALATTSLDFKYVSKGSFFSHEQRQEHCAITLNIAFPVSTVEFILLVKTESGHAGKPYPVLANEAGQHRDPNFSHIPPYPRLPFSNRDELSEAVQFGISLFHESKRAILSSGICRAEN
ncbi:MAG: hypothetical protein J2P21_08845 [Chloracidobacterium sp.]|nr:hypothetical protein [Chloracidobacterium sp.]